MEAYNSYNYTCINKNRYEKSDRGDTFLKWHVSIWAGCWSTIESDEMNIMTFTLSNSPQPIINKVSFARNLDIFVTIFKVLTSPHGWAWKPLYSIIYTLIKPFNSHEWPRKNFSLQYQYNIKQTSDENKEKYQLGIINWSNTKFSMLTSQELYGRQ